MGQRPVDAAADPSGIADDPRPRGSRRSLLFLHETRGLVDRSDARLLAFALTVLYALASMVVGGMLVFENLAPGYTVEIVWGNGLGTDLWSYPTVIVFESWGFVLLPFFATVAMVLVSVGVGLGMTVAALLVAELVRTRRSSSGRPATVGSAAGLTPAMIALVTLGACCSTTAAATAGVGLVAHASGSTPDNLLVNNWYLGVFQIAVVWVALIAQELVLRVYGGLAKEQGDGAQGHSVETPARGARLVAGMSLRVALLVGGITWSLAMLVEWMTVSPLDASAAVWARWLLEHLIPGGLAVAASLFPEAVLRSLTSGAALARRAAIRAVLAVAGVLLVFGAPPPLSAWGLEGFGNELLGVLGGPLALGAVYPVFPPGPDLFFRWAVQYLLVGGFALVAALAPNLALGPLRSTVARPRVVDGKPMHGPAGAAAPVPAPEP